MRKEPRQSESNLGTDNFDAEMVEAALVYHRELALGRAKGYAPVEVAAFIAGACWARLVLLGDEHGASGPGSNPSTGAGGGSSASKKTF